MLHGDSNTARFLDPRTRISHEVEFIGGSGVGVLAASFVPPITRGCVVVCPGLFNDRDKNHRRETLFCQALAQRGIAAVRFDYRGTADSGPDSFSLTFETMLADANAVADHITSRTDVTRIGFLGTRLGSMVAAVAANDRPVALWEPVLVPERFFRESFRARVMTELRLGRKAQGTADDFLRQLVEGGCVDMLGYSIGSDLYNSLDGADLSSAFGSSPGPVLLVEFARRPAQRQYEALVADLEMRGAVVSRGTYPRDEAWWFTNEVRHAANKVREASPLLDLTCDWFLAQLDPRQTA